MARYFNKSRGLITVSGRNGMPHPVGPKQWIEFAVGEDTSSSMLLAVRRGILIRSSLPEEVAEVAAAPVEAPVELVQEPDPAPVSKPAAPIFAPPARNVVASTPTLDVEKSDTITTPGSADAADTRRRRTRE